MHAAGVEVADTSGTRHAVAICADGDDTLWLAIADELGVKLLLSQLLATPGLAVTKTADHLRTREDTLRVVLTTCWLPESSSTSPDSRRTRDRCL